MAAALSLWVDKEVQPFAVKHLGSRIAKIELMSDYSCRASAGRVHNRLSEHAFADAIDIGDLRHGERPYGARSRQVGRNPTRLIAKAEASKAKADAELVAPRAAQRKRGAPGRRK